MTEIGRISIPERLNPKHTCSGSSHQIKGTKASRRRVELHEGPPVTPRPLLHLEVSSLTVYGWKRNGPIPRLCISSTTPRTQAFVTAAHYTLRMRWAKANRYPYRGARRKASDSTRLL
jgi:hypothetical protein